MASALYRLDTGIFCFDSTALRKILLFHLEVLEAGFLLNSRKLGRKCL